MRNLDRSFEETFKNHYLERALDSEGFKAFYLKEPGMGRMQSTLFLFTPEGIIITGDLCPGNDSRNSGVQAFGYGLSWFSQPLSEHYLCSKFLCEEFRRELAAERCREIAYDIMRGDTGRFDRDAALEEVTDRRASLAEELRTWLDLRRDPPEARSWTGMQGNAEVARIRREAAETRALLMERRAAIAQKYLEIGDWVEAGDVGREGFGDALRRVDSGYWEDCPGYGYDPRSASLLCALQRKFAALYPALAAAAVGG